MKGQWVEQPVEVGDTAPQKRFVPDQFCGAGGSDEGCVFNTVCLDPLTIEIVSLSEFWASPLRGHKGSIKVGDRYEVIRGRNGWMFPSAHMPWWFFNDDGTMSSH
jgi:hypothetical protein